MLSKNIENFAKSAKELSKNPLGIIALFIVLVYGIAALVAVSDSFTNTERLPLIYFLVIFPVLVLGVFAWLVSCHSNKLYAPSDYKNEDNFIRMQLDSVAALATANALSSNFNEKGTDTTKIAETVIKASTSINMNSERCNNQILWVDDRPENNTYERKAFEILGLKFSIALSTAQALELLKHRKFAAIISDMGRQEGPREGYVLLEKLREKDNVTPFFIYAGSNLPEHKEEALKNGAQGSTNDPNELYIMVTKTLLNVA